MIRDEITCEPGRSRTADCMRVASGVTRRAVLAGAASIAGGRRAHAAPVTLPGSPTLLVAGPPGSRADKWATLIAEPLGKSLQSDAVGRENVGGPDGVTGANHFQASTPPDGATAMIMPGATALSWLVGDTRVQFDAGAWAPLWGGTVSAIAVSRVPLARGRRVRVAVQSLVGPDLAALLALELMGVEAVPVAIAAGAAMPLDQADIDLVLLRGSSLKRGASELVSLRWLRVFGSGTFGADGRLSRDPAFRDVPTASELIERGLTERLPAERGSAERTKQLVAALRSVAAAASLDVALVLPLISPAAMIAWWRQGCAALSSAPDVQEEAARSFARPIEAGPMAANMASITAEPSALLELRRWLAERHQWRPG